MINNKNLNSLSIGDCPLAYLNLPQEVDINYLYYGNNKQVAFDISGSSFKITDIFPNINVANLNLLSGATQNGEDLVDIKMVSQYVIHTTVGCITEGRSNFPFH